MPNDPLVMTVDGKEYKFSFPGFKIHLDSEDEIRKLRRRECLNMIREYSQASDDKKNRESLRLAILSMFDNVLRDVTVQYSEIVQFINSPSGTAFVIWKCLLNHHPKMEQEEALNLYSNMNESQKRQVKSLGEPEENKVG